MRKIILYIFIIFAIGAEAQQLPQFRYQPFNRMVLNPASIGDYNTADVLLDHRSQWVGFEGAPIISTIAGKYPFREDMAAGAFISNDITGLTKRLYLNLNYAYLLKTDYFNISFGLAWTFTQYKVLGDRITLFQPEDAIISNISDATWKPDANAGIYLFSDKFFAGFSALQLFQSKFRFYQDNGTGATIESKRHFFITGGGKLEAGFGDHVFYPFTNMYIAEGTPFKFDLGVNYCYQNKILASLQYANADALVIQFGYRYDRYQISYAYDIITSRIRNVSSGAHEICLAVYLFERDDTGKISAPSF